jgi:hypothetical protein
MDEVSVDDDGERSMGGDGETGGVVDEDEEEVSLTVKALALEGFRRP